MVTNSAKSDDIDDSSAPLVEHLKELRSRLIWSVLAFVVAMVLCYFVWNPIFDFLTQPVCMALEKRGQTCGLILLKMQEGFFVAMRMSRLRVSGCGSGGGAAVESNRHGHPIGPRLDHVDPAV